MLSDDEVFAFWRASGRLGYLAGPAYRLLLLTGCRVNEIAGARWSELHPELRRVLRDAAKRESASTGPRSPTSRRSCHPAEAVQDDAEHAVHLTDAACEDLEGVPQIAGSDFIFTTSGEAPMWLGAKQKARLDARKMLKFCATWRRGEAMIPRGPSRTVGAARSSPRREVHLPALGVEDHVAEMVLGTGGMVCKGSMTGTNTNRRSRCTHAMARSGARDHRTGAHDTAGRRGRARAAPQALASANLVNLWGERHAGYVRSDPAIAL